MEMGVPGAAVCGCPRIPFVSRNSDKLKNQPSHSPCLKVIALSPNPRLLPRDPHEIRPRPQDLPRIHALAPGRHARFHSAHKTPPRPNDPAAANHRPYTHDLPHLRRTNTNHIPFRTQPNHHPRIPQPAGWVESARPTKAATSPCKPTSNHHATHSFGEPKPKRPPPRLLFP
jgi:hypothetical protein